MPIPDSIPPEIDGPNRKWGSQTEPINGYNLFDKNDNVWWTQTDNTDVEPGDGIDEIYSLWLYRRLPQGQANSLSVIYQTYNNQRYGWFVFPAELLDNGNYRISCCVLDKAGNAFTDAWDVTVQR